MAGSAAEYGAALDWVCPEPLSRLCGGRTESERRAALREYTEGPVRQGTMESPWDRLVAEIVLGSEAFAKQLRAQARANVREQPQWKALERPVSWKQILAALERHGVWKHQRRFFKFGRLRQDHGEQP